MSVRRRFIPWIHRASFLHSQPTTPVFHLWVSLCEEPWEKRKEFCKMVNNSNADVLSTVWFVKDFQRVLGFYLRFLAVLTPQGLSSSRTMSFIIV